MTAKAKTQERPAQRLYDLKAAARYLGRPASGVRELVYMGELPAVRQGKGGKLFLDVFDLDDYIARHKTRELEGVHS